MYKNLNPIFKDLFITLYPDINGNDIIYAKKYGYYAKVDIVVEVKNVKKGISLKMGSRNSVHTEKVDNFCNWLKFYNYKCIDELKYYIYSDGSNNNSGKIRLSIEEYKKDHYREIERINEGFKDKTLVEAAINRFLICADINYKIKVNAFLLGTYNDFIWATKEEVLDYLLHCQKESRGVHISNLFIQEWNKNLTNNPKYEYCREYIQVKWFSMFDDIISIMCKRRYI